MNVENILCFGIKNLLGWIHNFILWNFVFWANNCITEGISVTVSICVLFLIKFTLFCPLAEILGQRLLVEGDCSQKKSALLCYVCSGDVNELLNNWNTSLTSSPADIQVRSWLLRVYITKSRWNLTFFKFDCLPLQDLVELGLIMKEAVKSRGVDVGVSGALAKVLVQYAELLASQGYLTEAYTYLGEASNEVRSLSKNPP